MVNVAAVIFAFSIASASALPFSKRIAQVISDSTTQWEKACDAAGGGQQCNQVAVNSFGTLLAAGGNCDQQNAADNMVDLAKQLNNDPDMIKFAQIFAQQPRNSPNSVSVPYCQQAPKNAELNGLFQCQFQGDNAQTFVGGLAVGQPGTIPFGMSSALSPAGSCPANPSGPIADGTQLVDLTQDPGVAGSNSTTSTGATGISTGSATASSASSIEAPSSAASTPTAASSAAPTDSCDGGDSDDDTTEIATATASASTAASSATGTSSGGFQLQNGQAAQALNAQFQSLTANSSCQEGTDACVSGGFAQCVSGKYVISQCGATETCAALPLVNSAGTSITCTTTADAQSRIAATGATGGITGTSN